MNAALLERLRRALEGECALEPTLAALSAAARSAGLAVGPPSGPAARREAELFARWLLEQLEAHDAHGRAEVLAVELVPVAWRGRLEGYELALDDAPGARFPSAVLARVADAGPAASPLAVACAAALLRAALERLDPALLAAQGDARPVWVALRGGEALTLGVLDAAGLRLELRWDSSGATDADRT